MSSVQYDARERRSEARYGLGGCVRWSRPDTRLHGIDWVADRSDSSVAFVTSASMEPRMGEEVGIAAQEGRWTAGPVEKMRVRRVGYYGDRLLLVACVATE